jgi:hypothetical protein
LCLPYATNLYCIKSINQSNRTEISVLMCKTYEDYPSPIGELARC